MKRCLFASALASWAAGGEQSLGHTAGDLELPKHTQPITSIYPTKFRFTSGLEYQFALMLVVEVDKRDKGSDAHLVQLSVI